MMSGEEKDGRGSQLEQAMWAASGGRQQARTLAMLALVYATNSMYNVNYVFAVQDVEYRCASPAGHNGTDCSSWHYAEPDSFVGEFELAKQEWKQTLVGTAHCFGNMVGLLFQGQISDRFGRKKAAIFAGTMGAVLGITKSFASSYWTYVALETLEAAIGDALSPVFMLSIETVPKKRAIFYQMILLNCYTGGLIFMAFIAWAVPYWRYFLRVIYTPTLFVLAYSILLDESIRWLFSKGRRKEAVMLIQKIAKRNKIDIDKSTLMRLQYVDDEEPTGPVSDGKLLLQTFKSKIMLQRFLVCAAYWFTITLINYGMMVSSVLIEGNKYMNFALLMLMDIPANMLYWFILNKYKRKLPLMSSFIVGGIFCVTQPFIPKGYAWVGLLLFMLFEMLATFSYNIVYLYTSELFPTYTRNSVHSVCSSIGRFGSLLAPQTPLLMAYWSGLPQLIFGVTSLVCGALTVVMPETAGCTLPDTVLQAERIGCQQQADTDKDPDSETQAINGKS